MKQVIAAVFLFLMTSVVWADHQNHKGSHKAREVVEHGGAVAYSELASAVNKQFHGRIIRVELDRDDGRWYYKLRLLLDDGRVVKIEMDAKSLTVVEIKGKKLETVVKVP